VCGVVDQNENKIMFSRNTPYSLRPVVKLMPYMSLLFRVRGLAKRSFFDVVKQTETPCRNDRTVRRGVNVENSKCFTSKNKYYLKLT